MSNSATYKVVPYIVNLTKIAFAEDTEDATVGVIIRDSFKRFQRIFTFENPLTLNSFFNLSDFHLTTKEDLKANAVFTITSRLAQIISMGTLQKAACTTLALKLTNPSFIVDDTILELPDNLFQEILTSVFVLYWMPMRHMIYKVVIPHHAQDHLGQVYDMLADLTLFERLYDSCKDLQLFIYSWMQHVTFTRVHKDSNDVDEYLDTILTCLTKRNRLRNRVLPTTSQYINQGRSKEPLTFEAIVKSGSSQESHAIASRLQTNLTRLLSDTVKKNGQRLVDVITALLTGLKVANFLCEGSQYLHAIATAKEVYTTTKIYFNLAKRCPKMQYRLQYEAMCIVLRAMNGFIVYREAEDRQLFTTEAVRLLSTIRQLELDYSEERVSQMSDDYHTIEGIDKLPSEIRSFVHRKSVFRLCTAYLHAQLASYHYAMCHYGVAYQHTCMAIDEVREKSPHPLVAVEVLRVMCKLCTIKREFSLGMKVIRYAVNLAREAFGRNSLTYATMLLEYGCLLLNTDKTRMAAEIYRLGLTLILDCLPGCSVTASLALEDIAYAYYVLEYTSGSFEYALRCAKASGMVLNELGHPKCMQAASANRVRGLIIEEIAIDDTNEQQRKKLLEEAKGMHLASLELCRDTYGEDNIQTAKHYGNLGRLYQSMKSNQEAEAMHLKAIEIKEKLLGPSDFEVGLSVGHLASLYNYDMDRHRQAEGLYLRSVDISLKLFGPTYSGLEYDYRGLQRIYTKLSDREKLLQYQVLFDEWHSQRQRLRANEPSESSVLEPTADDLDVEDILREYTESCLFEWPEATSGGEGVGLLPCQAVNPVSSNSRRNGDCY